MAMALQRKHQETVCPHCGYPRWGSFHIPGICPPELFEVPLQRRFGKSNADLAEELVDELNEDIELAWENGNQDEAIELERDLNGLIDIAEAGFIRFKGGR